MTKKVSKTTAKSTTKKAAASTKSTKSKTASKTTTAKKTTSKKSNSKAVTANKSTSKKTNPKKSEAIKRSKENFAELRSKLEEERLSILQGLQKHNDNEYSTHGDLVDQSMNFSEHENMLGLAEHDRNRLVEINDAIEKIDHGTYGICSSCGCEIPQARLLAMPTAKYCLTCQSEKEYFS
jgi:DnaK suppressor protein